MKINNFKSELYIKSEKTFSQLEKTFKNRNPSEEPSECYILKNKEFEEAVYKLFSEYLDITMPNLCKVEESKKVVVECFYNGHWGYWKFSPLLGKVADKSGFSAVERWLDDWSNSKEDFEYNKKYFLWCLKVKYPVQEGQSGCLT